MSKDPNANIDPNVNPNQADPNAAGGNNTPPAADPNAPKTYTEDEVKMLLQREADRRVTPIAEKLNQTVKEFEEFKKAQMTEADRLKYEKEQEINNLRQVAQENASKVAKYQTLAEINKRGWDESVLDFLISDNEDLVREKADKMQKLIEAEAQRRANDALNKTKTNIPAGSNTNSTTDVKIDLKDPKAVYEAVKSGKLSIYQK